MIGLAYHFQLHPWDIGRLTIGHFEMYAAALDEMNRQAEERSKEAGRPVRKR
jgi:hypothetical protein